MKSFIKNLIKEKAFAFTVVGLIIILHSFFYSIRHVIPDVQKRKFTTGFSYNMAKHFLYFYYYKGLFPVATTETDKDYSRDGAEYQIENKGQSLVMEWQHWSRMGENARIFAFLPDAIFNGAEHPSIKLFNAIIFIIGLIAVFWSFYKLQMQVLGLFVVLIFSFTPFYLFEIYRNNNIFGLQASVALIILSLNLQFLFKDQTKWKQMIIPLMSAIIIGFFSEIRGEIKVLLLTVLLVYFFAKSLNISRKIAFTVILIGFYFVSSKLIRYYFNHKFELAAVVVKEAGGNPYTGSRALAHSFWHPVFCGLGDFDKKYGYVWNDTVAYHYSLPFLKNQYSIDLPYSGKYHFDAYYDSKGQYYKKFEEFSEYDKIIKNKVLSNIKSDPKWFAEIIFKRINRVLTNTLPFKNAGWIALLAFIYLIWTKKWKFLQLIIITLPLSLTPLMIYSGGNSTYNSIFPIIALALILALLAENLILKGNTRISIIK